MMLPLFHANAQVVTTIIPMLIGCEVVIWERFSASRFWREVEELAPTTISAVPTILAAVLNAPGAPEGRQLTAVRHLRRGAPVRRALAGVRDDRFGIRILEGFGMTETACIASLNPYYAERKAGSIGLPIRGQEMRIVDRETAPRPAPAGTGRSSSRART